MNNVPLAASGSSQFDTALRYQAMTDLPEHIERKLLTFNIMQLCVLVREKSGAGWSGASDRYGPIQEIARRWGAEDLFRRISDIPVEDDIVTYSRIMTAHGGNPSLKDGPRPVPMHPDIKRTNTSRTTMAPKDDVVAPAMLGCKVEEDLLTIVREKGLRVSMETFNKLPNFGLKRMLVGNAWRTLVRQQTKK